MLGIGLVISELTSRLQGTASRLAATGAPHGRAVSHDAATQRTVRDGVSRPHGRPAIAGDLRRRSGAVSARAVRVAVAAIWRRNQRCRAADQRRRRPVGGDEWKNRRRRHRYVAECDGTVRAAGRFAASCRSAGRRAEGKGAVPRSRAGAAAGNVRQPDRAVDRARRIGAQGP